MARGDETPRYHTVYNVIRALPAALSTLALDGEKRYRQAYDLIHRREATRPNEIWQADHTQLDLWARRENGEVARPWLTVIIDDHSRMVAGFLFAFDSPSSIQTALALRQAIWRKSESYWIIAGIPETFYTDNGSDFSRPRPPAIGQSSMTFVAQSTRATAQSGCHLTTADCSNANAPLF
jgi:putative transposase